MAEKIIPKTTRVNKNKQEPQGVHSSANGDVQETKTSVGLVQWIKGLFGGRVRVVDDPQDSRDDVLRDMISQSVHLPRASGLPFVPTGTRWLPFRR